uniref:Uncharacterized protein n=1 Tax=Anguilla anguilla TaxID=7936 RepID=A0A0E9WMJ7_ANGAN
MTCSCCLSSSWCSQCPFSRSCDSTLTVPLKVEAVLKRIVCYGHRHTIPAQKHICFLLANDCL